VVKDCLLTAEIAEDAKLNSQSQKILIDNIDLFQIQAVFPISQLPSGQGVPIDIFIKNSQFTIYN
jgi:hypothetical protein